MSGLVRLNKHLAHTLGMSRREADAAIEAGRVLVNNKAASLGTIIQPDRDSIQISGEQVSTAPKRYTYLLMNKPVGYVCSRKKQGDNPTIYDLLPRQYHRLKVAGRLDKDSCGLLLLTDDGDTIFKLTHPKFAKKKIYNVALNKPLREADWKKIEQGIELEDGVSTFTTESINGKQKIPNLYKVTMSEGRNRQIRRTFKALSYTVTHLERVQLSTHQLNTLGNQKYLQI